MKIQENRTNGLPVPIQKASELFGVSRSGYYQWLERQRCPDDKSRDTEIRSKIHAIALEYPKYGYRRIAAELRHRGYIVNRKKVLRLMREDNLLCLRKRFTPLTTNSNHNYMTYPNLARYMSVTDINQLWVVDITYIQLPNEFVYLAMVMEVHSRRCIGWDLSRSINTELALNALKMGIMGREKEGHSIEGLVHHSDQGVQYCSNDYVDCLNEHGIQISMSRRGNPYDNAFAESFMKTLKYEEVYMKEYRTFNEALQNIGQFIEEIYNRKRLHSSIGYVSPMSFEEALCLNTQA